MAKLKSSLMAYFINIGTTITPEWARLGKGVTEFPLAYNPQVTTETYIDEDNASNSVDSYQVSAGITIALHDSTTAPAHGYLEEMRKNRAVGAAAETQILEIDISGDSPYPAQLQNAVVAVDTFTLTGGQPQTLGVTIYYNGDPQNGTAVITAGAPSFTPTPAT